jgi:hypothetical protein
LKFDGLSKADRRSATDRAEFVPTLVNVDALAQAADATCLERPVTHTLEPKTRTVAVELDVPNPNLKLASGMYAEIQWPVRKEWPALLVPPASIATTTERTFVFRIMNEVAEWVPVSRGAAVGDLDEVYGLGGSQYSL